MVREPRMTRRISLALTLHNHQPIGNFGWVIADVFEQAYAPMVEALGRHPSVRLALHYSGPLLEWLRRERPGFVDDVRALVERGQVEILGGGLHEPILVALPGRDRVAQLRLMADAVEDAVGVRPRGAWLAERVWEPDLPASLAGGGYGWTVLDDAHFRAAAVPEDEMWGPYTTEDQGRLISVFGTEQGLRYLIPFREVEEVIDYLRDHATEAGDRVGTMGDDGEKFGSWPSTFEHCWGKGRWVERFFEALDANASWLTTVRPSDWLATSEPVGRIAIPSGSYAEMGEWALPPAEARAFGAALHHARQTGGPEARWMRGASWRNFQVKYREVNDLHKQMLRTSAAVDAMPVGDERSAALDHLYRGQSNDCYWHGLFGGIYITHMRAATLAHLIAAEAIADAALGRDARTEMSDLDLDGRDEILLANAGQVVTVDLDEGAGIGAWDLRGARHAVTAVLRRRPEAYHATIREHEAKATAAAGAAAAAEVDAATTDGAASIHERVLVKEEGLGARLVYDDYERRSGLIRILAADATPETWNAGGRDELGDFVAGRFRVAKLGEGEVIVVRDGAALVDGTRIPLTAQTTIRIGGGATDPTLAWEISLENLGDRPLVGRVGVEWATTMLGGGGNPDAWWSIGGVELRHDASDAASGVTTLGQGNRWLRTSIETEVSPAADAWIAPIETVSNSEAGFERVYQGSSLLLSWPVNMPPGSRWSARLVHRARVEPDSA
jgi:alpha-amylase